MADCRMGLTDSPLVLLLLINLVFGFNLDLNAPFVFSKDPDTYFGYSLALHDKSIIIGAPLAVKAGVRSGIVYKCVADDKNQCDLLQQVGGTEIRLGINDGQWMGSSVYSGGTSGYILACSSRWQTREAEGIFMPGKCEIVNDYDTDAYKVWSPCRRNYRTKQEYQFCLLGFSAQFTPGDAPQVFSGTPNMQLETGRIYAAPVDIATSYHTLSAGLNLNISAYMGYSATSGRYAEDQSKIVFVGGAPRAERLRGRVILYKNEEDFPVLGDYIDDPSGKMGTYFGASVANPDVNCDGYPDLVVGAPHFPGKTHGEGAVHIFINNKQGGVEYKGSIYGDEQTEAQFGSAVENVGDLNYDDCEDFIVGAPFGGKGTGAAYLYFGNKVQVPEVYKQKLTPDSFGAKGAGMTGFGASFSGRVDMDNNMYPDVAIGSFRSSKAMIVRTRPVANVVATLDLRGVTKIDLLNDQNICTRNKKTYKCINTEVCIMVVGIGVDGNAASVDYTFTVDADRSADRRAFVVDASNNEVNTLQVNIPTVGARTCKDYMVYVAKDNTKDIFDVLVLDITYKYREAAVCNVCPMMSAINPSSTRARVTYVKGCGADGICESDLVVKAMYSLPDGARTIQVGISNVVNVDVEVKNLKENAFINRLKVVYSKTQITPNKVTIKNYPGTVIWEPDVTRDSPESTLAVVLTSPLVPNAVENIQITFGVGSIPSGTKLITVTASAESESNETDPANNKIVLDIPVSLVANLTVSASVSPETLSWTQGVTSDRVVGPTIRHAFLFQNLGPSSADLSNVVISYPEKLDGKFFLNLRSIVLDGRGSCNPGGSLNPLGLNVTVKNTNTTRSRRAVQESRPAGRELDCGTASCRVITCTLLRIQKGESASLELEASVVESTFENNIKDTRVIVVSAKFTSSVVDRPVDSGPDTATVRFAVNTPYMTKTVGGKSVAWWIILLAVLAAVVIIALIVFLMWKKGFFKRKKHGEANDFGEDEGLNRGNPEEE